MNSSRPNQSLSLLQSEEEDAPIAASFAGTLRAFSKKQQPEPSRLRPLPAAAVAQRQPVAALKRPERTIFRKPVQKDDAVESPGKTTAARKRIRTLRSPLFVRAWNWLQKQHVLSAKKQLRVSETVSLGEKRFVAVVQTGRQKFLIGGGASGVSLLAELDTDSELDDTSVLEMKDASQAPQPIACAGGQSR